MTYRGMLLNGVGSPRSRDGAGARPSARMPPTPESVDGHRDTDAGAGRRGLAGAGTAVLAALALAVVAACAGSGAPPADRVRVSAAVSLTGPLERVADGFERDTGTAVELNLAGSSTLAAQILAGAPVDLFISADERQMDRVAAELLIDTETRVALLSNRLAVVVPAGEAGAPRGPAELRGPAFRRIAIGDPAGVPAGVYGRCYLASLGLWDALAPRVVPTRSVRAEPCRLSDRDTLSGRVRKKQMQALEVGLFVMPAHPPERSVIDGHHWDLSMIRAADRFGYKEAWVGEHLNTPWEPCPSPELVIAQALTCTEQITLGAGAHILPNHHPARLAQTVAYLDHLAEGRYMLGIGAGGGGSGLFGYGEDAPKERYAHLREALAIMVKLWTEPGPWEYVGQNWHVTKAASPGDPNVPSGRDLTPYQKPHPPIGVPGLTPGLREHARGRRDRRTSHEPLPEQSLPAKPTGRRTHRRPRRLDTNRIERSGELAGSSSLPIPMRKRSPWPPTG